MMNKRLSALMLSVLMVFSLLLGACANNQPSEGLSAEATYKVTVVDGLGNPYTEKIIVKLMQNGAQVAMGAINAQGVYEKVLPRGEYTVEVASTNSDLKIHFESASLTAETVETQVIMSYVPTSSGEIGVATGETKEDEEGNLVAVYYQADRVTAGSYFIELDEVGRTYVIFAPSEAGIYEFSVTNGDAAVGYYGAPHFVQSNNIADMNGDKFTMSIDAGMIGTGNSGTSVLVIGLDGAEGKDSCVLNINRLGDPAWNIDSEPWNAYNLKIPASKFTLESGVTLVDFDLTASTDTYKLVLNETDGCYRLGSEDGPKVYVRLGVSVYGICMKDMVGEIVYDADGILMQTGTAPFRYMYNNGQSDFFKEDYTDAMRQIVSSLDKSTGVYPLTKDLYYMLPLGMANKGWCTEGTASYLFNGVDDINPELCWMFLLCHAEGDIGGGDSNTGNGSGDTTNNGNNINTNPNSPIEDNKDEPIEIGSTLNFTAEVKANHIVYFDLYRVNDTTLTIKDKNAYVIYNGVTYEAKNGVVTVPDLYSQYTNLPVQIAIGNKGTANATYDVTLSYAEGHLMNPKNLNMGSFTVESAKNNEQGVYYTWTATKAGTLTLNLDKVTSKSGNVKAGITITVTDKSMVPRQVSLGDQSDTMISVDVQAGDTVVINIGALPNEQNKYLAATIDITATFQ